MDSESLHYSLDLAAGNGLTLSSEQRAALQTSLVILKRNYKFSRVLFWGKILGIKCDYFIAQGVEDDEMKNKKSLYSLNCMDWHLLPPATESMIADVALAAQGRFTGDPSHEYEHTETRIKGEGDDATEEEVTVKVNEASRLATAVSNIDKDASVVPRGAFTKSPSGKVQTNRSFGGSWSLQLERGSTMCVLRSLLWLGLTFFHIPQTPQHGYIYMGDGLMNLDLPFML
ncbi:radial spoke head protein 9 homolog isoform X3 [Cyprinus carpio]|uniref:Radial spoke head protein 9 homolog n=1 Tax=Cyprinus carpio TaxID=7962 RepID=A0A9Q9XL53_CYPCA|nr:radial spoke head protein 9 homolog isoform X3 [Cyprinus carpio]